MFTQIKNMVCAKETREGEGFTHVHQDYVAHVVLLILTPGTAVMTICSLGKPGEMEEKDTREGEGFTYVHQNSVDKRASYFWALSVFIFVFFKPICLR